MVPSGCCLTLCLPSLPSHMFLGEWVCGSCCSVLQYALELDSLSTLWFLCSSGSGCCWLQSPFALSSLFCSFLTWGIVTRLHGYKAISSSLGSPQLSVVLHAAAESFLSSWICHSTVSSTLVWDLPILPRIIMRHIPEAVFVGESMLASQGVFWLPCLPGCFTL